MKIYCPFCEGFGKREEMSMTSRVKRLETCGCCHGKGWIIESPLALVPGQPWDREDDGGDERMREEKISKGGVESGHAAGSRVRCLAQSDKDQGQARSRSSARPLGTISEGAA